MINNDTLQELIKLNPKIELAPVLEELKVWEETLDNDLFDDTILHTIETVTDILIDHSYKE